MESSIGFPSSLGFLLLSWTERGICRLQLLPEGRARGPKDAPEWVRDAAERIRLHLSGKYADLAAIPIDLEGLAPFHRRVYEALHRTHPGQTLTYGELALLAGSPGAARAVGQAMKRNPIPILVPCHRVVASNGPGGFSMLGGMASKERLLALEGVGHTGMDDAPSPR